MSSEAKDASVLLSRLRKSNSVPRGWAILDSSQKSQSTPRPTVRHSKCALFLPQNNFIRCYQCTSYRQSLGDMVSRNCKQRSIERTAPSSNTNYRYLSKHEMVDQLHRLHENNLFTQKKCLNLQTRVSELIAKVWYWILILLHAIMQGEEETVLSQSPENSFQQVFWQQQKEVSCRDKRSMRWHPAMVKWCLYLHHQSSKAYKILRSSGCISLPSQRTLRDYTHWVKSDAGFSTAVDLQLMQAADMSSCQQWEKLLLDEMYIREDLVYNKYSEKLIGFANLGSILLAFEQANKNDQNDGQDLAKTKMVFMVKGLFSPLRFPYAQFPCAIVTGDMIFGRLYIDLREWSSRFDYWYIATDLNEFRKPGLAVVSSILSMHVFTCRY